ncbi:MAG: DUF3343 domain-containing protein [Clostridia bacterium]|nr:DUF3343 domain-containing protein [Clostridia bacterium]
MANHYIHVGSVTNAMRGKQLLEKNGIRAYLHRSTARGEGEGCGYSLLVSGDDRQATKILQNSGVRVIRVTDAL